MLHRDEKRLVVLAAVVVLATGASCTKGPDSQPNLAGQDVALTVIHTADLHSRIFPYQFAPGQIDKSLGLHPSHGNIAIVGGAARIATVVKRIRASSERVIHVDSGDIFEGAPVFNLFTGEAEMKVWTKIGVTAMALGNHEFDKGPVNLELMKSQFGGFPILAANYIFDDPSDPTLPKLRNLIYPFTIVNAQGLRIGIIGMGNLSSLDTIVEGGNPLGIRPLDTAEVMQDTVRVLRPQVDLLIVLSHLGLDEDEATAQTDMSLFNNADQNAAAAIEGVDVIFGGHLHIVLNPPKDLARLDAKGNPAGHTIICHSGAFAKYVGRLDLVVHVAEAARPDDPKQTVDDRRSYVKSYAYKLTPIDDSIPEDPDVARILEPYQLQMNTVLNLTQNYAVIPCDNAQTTCPKIVRSDSDGGDAQLGNLVAASMRLRRRVEADFGLTNTLGIRADFESGPLNLEEMYNVFPFDNTITTLYLSGHEIGTMMDFVSYKSAQRGCKSQAQVSGLWYLMDCTNNTSCGPYQIDGKLATHCNAANASSAAGGWLSNNPIDGPPLIGDKCMTNGDGSAAMVDPGRCTKVLPNGEYRAAVNDYIAAGGSGFAVLKNNTTKFNTGISLRDALLDYIREIPGRCDPTKNQNIIYNAQDLTEPSRPCAAASANADYAAKCGANFICPTTDCQAACQSGGQPAIDAVCGAGYKCPTGPCLAECVAAQPMIDMQCGPGHVCDVDPARTSDSHTYCLRHYDLSGLPCLDFNIEAHDGRIGHAL